MSFLLDEPVVLNLLTRELAPAHACPDRGFNRTGMGQNAFDAKQVSPYRVQGGPSAAAGERKHAIRICLHHFAVPPRAGDGLRVQAKESQVLIEIFDLGSLAHHVYQQFTIPAGTIVHVEAAHGLKGCAPEKRSLLQPGGASVEITIQGKACRTNASNALTLGIDNKTVAHHDVAIGVLRESLRDTSQCSWQQYIVRVQKSKYVPGSVLKTVVQSVGSSFVGFENDSFQLAREAFDEFAAAIRRARGPPHIFYLP